MQIQAVICMLSLSESCLKQAADCIFSKQLRVTRAAIITHGVSHQMSREVLGHYVVCNVTKFQSCRPNNYFVIDEKWSRKHFEKNNIIE